jgi:hypothetical protein
VQAIRSTHAGGRIGFVDAAHGVQIPGEELFYAEVHLHGGATPVRRFLPQLIELVLDGKIHPGKVFDLTLPLEQVAEGYQAMDERRAINALLRNQNGLRPIRQIQATGILSVNLSRSTVTEAQGVGCEKESLSPQIRYRVRRIECTLAADAISK